MKIFFASSNSSKGFHNDFSICLGKACGVERLYIIKGGPGTGKSYFLHTVAKYAVSQGYDATYYACSSDPSSLDGIRLEKKGKPCVALMDGTAPHVCEPTLPGIQEDLVNLGAFWDTQKLRASAQEVKNASRLKSAAYAEAYQYLSAAGKTQEVADDLILPCVQHEKLCALASRIVKHQPTGKVFCATPAHLRAVSMSGKAYLDTFEQMAKASGGDMVVIQDYYGTAWCLTQEILRMAEHKKCKVLVSRDPVHLSHVDGIFFEDTGLCVLVSKRTEDASCASPHAHTVSLRRYVDAKKIKEIRTRLRQTKHLTDALTDAALESLHRAGKYHFELEAIYASAMDFSQKEAYTQDFCQRIFQK